ncbi:hypothetical protein FP804_00760 [archaeon]|nr:hypothetical protein [archaeon]
MKITKFIVNWKGSAKMPKTQKETPIPNATFNMVLNASLTLFLGITAILGMLNNMPVKSKNSKGMMA